jgi:hypothetical protein
MTTLPKMIADVIYPSQHNPLLYLALYRKLCRKEVLSVKTLGWRSSGCCPK